jgi:hypothetical protein
LKKYSNITITRKEGESLEETIQTKIVDVKVDD